MPTIWVLERDGLEAKHRWDWIWTTITPEDIEKARGVIAVWRRTPKLRPHRFVFTEDAEYQQLVGVCGEIAFRRATGRHVGTVAELVGHFKHADVDGYEIKSIGWPTYRLLLDARDLEPPSTVSVALVYVQVHAYKGTPTGRCAIVGWKLAVDVPEVWYPSGKEMPRPCMVVDQKHLERWT